MTLQVLTAAQWDASKRYAAELVLIAMNEDDDAAEALYRRVGEQGLLYALSASTAGLVITLAEQAGVNQMDLRRWLAGAMTEGN